ncbi:abortive infection system antitoxin AbiGi family protein [Rariglobus hedericola]|uniref:Uncharacterized protein n=1 Tax=Rariglobus hedericola TaxID=2597822 RepID=A0A556QMH0_9BACT|nr:abortive infection system antitoxin AbiGi family protein [Rariglobus hedericola]TSJ77792.1 hypothetical protein FPL22_00350 [Rariglobus hedericola]
MSTAKTSSLFHFTKNVGTIQSILKNGFWPTLSLEDQTWLNQSHWAFPVVCFCDIPISRLTSHLNYYGNYGIGMSQEWAIEQGLSPVVYINSNSPFAGALHALANQKKKKSRNDFAAMAFTLGHTKPLKGKDKRNGRNHVHRNFYEECEWRYVPPIDIRSGSAPIDEKTYRNKKIRGQINESLKANYALEVKPEDIRYILLSKESEIPEMCDYFTRWLGHHSADSLKVLMTKIISVERILSDV